MRRLSELETNILRWGETQTINEALQRRKFNKLQLRNSLLCLMIMHKRHFFDEMNKTTLDDAAIISQLDMDAHHISMTVKQMREDLKMPEMALAASRCIS